MGKHKKEECVEKWVILFSMWVGFVGASESNRLVAYGIPSYNKSGGNEPFGIPTMSAVDYALGDDDWVAHFKNNPGEYLSMSPENVYELHAQLRKKNKNLSEKKLVKGKQRIIKYYIAELGNFEKEFRCSTNNVIGYGAVTTACILGNVTAILYIGLHCLDYSCNGLAETIGISVGGGIVMNVMFLSGSLFVERRHARRLHHELHSRGNERLSAMYEVVVNRLGKKIGW